MRLHALTFRAPALLLATWLLAMPSLYAGAGVDFAWDRTAPLPDRMGFGGSFAGESQGVLIVAGGANFPDAPPWEGGRKVWHDRVFVLREPSADWEAAGRLPFANGYGASVAVDGDFVMIGGGDAVRNTREVRLVRWREGKVTFEVWPELPVPLANAAGALVGRSIYLAGGLVGPEAVRAENILLRLDVDHLRAGWQQLPPCPGGGRFLAVAAAHEGRFYLFGGARLVEDENSKARREVLGDAWRFSMTDGWQRIADLPHPVVAAPTPAPAVRRSIFLLGGDDGSQMGVAAGAHRGFARSIFEYQPDLDIWLPRAELPFALVTTPVATWSGRLVVPGGESRPGERSTQVWISRPLLPKAPTPR